MATKNLARTIMEGGRTNRSKARRRRFNRTLRSENKRYLQDFLRGGDDEIDTIPRRRPVERDFGDKLSPASRWLARHGRGMTIAELEGLVCRTFDPRSLKQWHVGFAHLFLDLQALNQPRSKGVSYYVDRRYIFDGRGRLVGVR